jgi:hypothetical protein
VGVAVVEEVEEALTVSPGSMMTEEVHVLAAEVAAEEEAEPIEQASLK